MILKLSLVFLVFLILLFLKIDLYIVVLGSGLLLSFLFNMPPQRLLQSVVKSAASPTTLNLLLLIYFVLLLVEVQKEKSSLPRLLRGMAGLLPSRFLQATLSPALIGLLPMPGGALVSAPMVEEVVKDENLTPEIKTFANYWFRHIWEFFWPLYQGFILTVAVFEIKAVGLMAHQFYFTFIAAALGYILLWKDFKGLRPENPESKGHQALKDFLYGSWEILTIIILILLAKLPLVLSLVLVVSLSSLLSFSLKKAAKLLPRAFNHKILLLILSVMIFKGLVKDSSLFPMLTRAVSSDPRWTIPLMVLLPFSIGFLTGVNSAFVGIAFPLFIPVVGKNMDGISLLYISGFAGVLLSPLHLCLVLSAEFFGARLIKVYKYIFPAVAVILVLAIIIFG